MLTSFQIFFRQEGSSGILLLLVTVLAVLWANSPFSQSYFSLWTTKLSIGLGDLVISKDLLHWINDGLMTFFFFVVGLEIKRELLVGELSRPRQALFPVAAALGGMVVPALFYVAINAGGPGDQGWGIPMATDIAFALGILSLMGKRAPTSLKVFLTAVAIVDDIGAVLVITLFYTEKLVLSSLAVGAVALLGLIILNRRSVANPLPYSLVGIVLWLAFLQSGIHATVAGVLLAATIPARPRIDSRSFLGSGRAGLESFEKAGEPGRQTLTNKKQRAALYALERAILRASSPLQRLEHVLHPWVAYAIIPLFAFANAGVDLSGNLAEALGSPIALGIVLGLVLGKQLGITLVAWGLERIGLVSKPRGLSWRQIYGAAWLAGIGFTMSLFITSLAFEDAAAIATAKIAILLASIIAALGGRLVLQSGGAAQAEA